MKTIVLSKGKPEHQLTTDWFQRHDYSDAIWVITEEDNKEEYEETTGCEVVVAECDGHRLSHKRQWAVDTFTSKKNPWLSILEDNIIKVTGVEPDQFYTERFETTTRALYHDKEYSPQEVVDVMKEDSEHCDSIGAKFGGYASNDNHFFRKVRYRTVGFVWTKMCYIHRHGPQQATYLPDKCDYGYTAEALKQDGKVLINNFLYPWNKKFEGRGGSPTLEQRVKPKKTSVKLLLKKFPDMFRIKDRKGFPEGTEIQLRFHSEKQVEKWMKENG